MANTIDLTGDLPLVVPVKGATNWDEDMKNKTFQKIADHDHTAGKGSQIDTAALKDNAVTNAKMADNAVDTAEIVDNAVTTAKIANSMVTESKLSDALKEQTTVATQTLEHGDTHTFTNSAPGNSAYQVNYRVTNTTNSGACQTGQVNLIFDSGNGAVSDEFIGTDMQVTFGAGSGTFTMYNGSGNDRQIFYTVKKLGL